MTQSNPTEPIWRNFDWNSLPVTTLRRYTVDAQDKGTIALPVHKAELFQQIIHFCRSC